MPGGGGRYPGGGMPGGGIAGLYPGGGIPGGGMPGLYPGGGMPGGGPPMGGRMTGAPCICGRGIMAPGAGPPKPATGPASPAGAAVAAGPTGIPRPAALPIPGPPGPPGVGLARRDSSAGGGPSIVRSITSSPRTMTRPRTRRCSRCAYQMGMRDLSQCIKNAIVLHFLFSPHLVLWNAFLRRKLAILFRIP